MLLATPGGSGSSWDKGFTTPGHCDSRRSCAPVADDLRTLSPVASMPGQGDNIRGPATDARQDQRAKPMDVEPEDLLPGLAAVYKSGDGTRAITRFDMKLAFSIIEGTPHPRIPPGPFDVTWHGLLVLNERGPIAFDAFVCGELAVRCFASISPARCRSKCRPSTRGRADSKSSSPSPSAARRPPNLLPTTSNNSASSTPAPTARPNSTARRCRSTACNCRPTDFGQSL